jgi:hypothetical protein
MNSVDVPPFQVQNLVSEVAEDSGSILHETCCLLAAELLDFQVVVYHLKHRFRWFVLKR